MYDGEPNQLYQVIMNIVNNAKDAFKEKNQKHKEIVIKSWQDDNRIKIEISDNPMFNRLAAIDKQVNTITLCKDGIDANYYNVVEVANMVKEIYNPKISSLVLLKQLIHMVCNKEMEPFHLIVIDMDSKEYKGYVDKHGVIHEVYVGSMSNSKIMQEYRKYSGFIYAY